MNKETHATNPLKDKGIDHAGVRNLLTIAEDEVERRESRWLLRSCRSVLAAVTAAPESRSPQRKSIRFRAYRRLLSKLPTAIREALEIPQPNLTAFRSPQAQQHEGQDVLLMSHELSPTGAPKIVQEMASILLSSGYRVTVISPKDGPFREQLLNDGAHVVIDEGALVPSRLVRAMAAEAAFTICNTAITFRVAAAVSPHRPCLWYIHETDWVSNKLSKDAEFREACQGPQQIWAGSELPAELIRPHRKDVVVVPYGTDLFPLPEAKPPTGRKLSIGIFGSLEPRKGQDLAISALRLLPAEVRSCIELKIYGRIFFKRYSDGLLAAIKDAPEAQYCGEMDFSRYRETLQATDVILIPSTSDTLPLVSLDALSSGRVLICTKETGTSRYLTHGKNGFIIDQPTPVSIAHALAEAVMRKGDWESIGLAGRQTFIENFSREKFERKFRDLVDRVLEARPG